MREANPRVEAFFANAKVWWKELEALRPVRKRGATLRCVRAGEPGPRQGETTTYYGAFIFGPDGNKVEAVTFPQ